MVLLDIRITRVPQLEIKCFTSRKGVDTGGGGGALGACND